MILHPKNITRADLPAMYAAGARLVRIILPAKGYETGLDYIRQAKDTGFTVGVNFARISQWPGRDVVEVATAATEADAAAVADAAPVDVEADAAAGRRLAAGMRLLCGIDVTDAVRNHPGPLLQIVGSHSQLVTRRHTAAAPHHRVHVAPGAGMRPHAEQPTEVAALIEAYLWEKGLR
jgi:pimeloyl-ACP methyl ester carboxylesterase